MNRREPKKFHPAAFSLTARPRPGALGAGAPVALASARIVRSGTAMTDSHASSPHPRIPVALVVDSLNDLIRALETAGGERQMISILLLSADGERLQCLAAPSLPRAYCNAIEGAPIGPRAGSCGTAAWFGHDVFVTDIEHDPRWTDYRDVALAHGLQACWSTPVSGADGHVAGTFAVYHREPRSPSEQEVAAIRLASRALAPLLEAARAARATAA